MFRTSETKTRTFSFLNWFWTEFNEQSNQCSNTTPFRWPMSFQFSISDTEPFIGPRYTLVRQPRYLQFLFSCQFVTFIDCRYRTNDKRVLALTHTHRMIWTRKEAKTEPNCAIISRMCFVIIKKKINSRRDPYIHFIRLCVWVFFRRQMTIRRVFPCLSFGIHVTRDSAIETWKEEPPMRCVCFKYWVRTKWLDSSRCCVAKGINSHEMTLYHPMIDFIESPHFSNCLRLRNRIEKRESLNHSVVKRTIKWTIFYMPQKTQ